MKITETTEKYLINFNKRKFLLEELKNEKGEKVFSISEIRKYTLPNGEEWEEKTDGIKAFDWSNSPDDIKKVIREIIIRL
jgi:hypothetical protein